MLGQSPTKSCRGFSRLGADLGSTVRNLNAALSAGLKTKRQKARATPGKCKNATCLLLQEEDGEKDPLIDIFEVSLFLT